MMASYDVLPTLVDFALAGLFAVGYSLLFAPLWDGFVILGFEAMLGCMTAYSGRWLLSTLFGVVAKSKQDKLIVLPCKEA